MTKQRKAKFSRNTLAMVYDFDGTLTPQPMQEYTVLPQLGIRGEAFWEEVNEEVIRTGGDSILTYMRLLVEKIDENKTALKPGRTAGSCIEHRVLPRGYIVV